MRRRSALVLPAALLFLAHCTPPEPPVDPNEFRTQWDAYTAALSAANAEGMAAFYFDDGMRIPPDKPPQRGLPAVREYLTNVFAENVYVLDEATPDDIQVSGNLAAVRATYRDHSYPRGGGDTTWTAGRWLSVWGRTSEGLWKIRTEMWTVESIQ